MKLEALKRPQTSAKAVDCTVVTRLALNRVHNSAKAQQLLLITVQQTPRITFPVFMCCWIWLDPHLTVTQSCMIQCGMSSGQILGERGGTTFPFCFRRGNAVPLAYTTAVGGRGKRPSVVRWQLPTTQATEKVCMIKVTPIVNRGNFKSCIL